MIRELTVENLAIIDQATILFQPGFTAMTGETGAGKSLVIDSIHLAIGGRADSTQVRNGAPKATICLVADLRSNLPAVAKCALLGIDLEDGTLIIQREISAEGRSTVRLNGRPSTVSVLKEIGALLIDLNGQNDHQSLLEPDFQMDFLDQWIGHPLATLQADYFEQFEELRRLKSRLNTIHKNQREREQRIDMLQFQIAEITEVAPLPNESEELSQKLFRLQHAEKLGRTTITGLECLSDDEDSALVRISTTLQELQQLSKLDPEIERIIEPIQSAEAILCESIRSLRSYTESLDCDPETLQETAERIDTLTKLKRKYGDSEGAIIQYLDSAERELHDLLQESQNEGSLESEILLQQSNVQEIADKISALRKEKAKLFQTEVQDHILELAIPNAKFAVRFEKQELQSNGQDLIEFDFSANPGEPMRPLGKVASGGELSRIMLAIKVASAGKAGVPTLVFDEIDTGLSGRTAAIMANKILRVAKSSQVLCISHLPQVAGKAEHHFLIEKIQSQSTTNSSIRALNLEQRVQEIARMLAGEQVSQHAIENAIDLLKRTA